MPILELGHTGVWVRDLDTMRRFYTDVMGLTVTDEDADAGLVFLSARPDVEHHEFVLARGRTAPDDVKVIQQISWRIDSLATLLEFHRRFQDEGVQVQQEVTHGNALSIYFFDPEGNRVEVYVRVDEKVHQPFRKHLDLEQDEAGVLTQARYLLEEDTGPRYGTPGGDRAGIR